jgi:hypothetical protein
MENLRLHSVVPTTNKTFYGEFDQIEFNANFSGRKMLPGTMRLEADLTVLYDGTDFPSDAEVVFMNDKIGAQSLVDGITIATDKQGVLENIGSGYGHLVSMLADATLCESDYFNGDVSCELRTGNYNLSKVLLYDRPPKVDQVANDAANRSVDFSIKPIVCLNQATNMSNPAAKPAISYDTTGTVQITFTLSRTIGTFFGDDVDGTTVYRVSQPRLTFLSVPDDGKQDKL